MNHFLDQYISLLEAVRDNTKEYINSTVLLEYDRSGRHIALDIKELLLVAAISGSDCLFSGKTGAGKTSLARGIMTALFGKEAKRKGDYGEQTEGCTPDAAPGYVEKTITPAMRPEEFLDLNYADIEKTGSLRQAITGTPILSVPGVILNEANRAPALIQNFLIPFLDRRMDIEGVSFSMGVPARNSRRYQFRIVTINEGGEYQVEEMDKALRDRMAIEIPMDAFLQSEQDCRTMLQSMMGQEGSFSASEQTSDNAIGAVFDFPEQLNDVPIDSSVFDLLVYLSGMSYCLQVAKRGQWPPVNEISESLDICRECHMASNTETNRGNLCGAVRSLSQRAMRQLLHLARGLAIAATTRITSGDDRVDPKVIIDDIWALAPFVMFQKLQLSDFWLRENLHSQWLATYEALKLIRKRWERLVEKGLPRTAQEAATLALDLNDFWVMRFGTEDRVAALEAVRHAFKQA